MQIFAPLNSEQLPELQRIEVASSFQLPGFHIIGLPAPEVSEAKERIRAAMEHSGFELPKRRVVLNLAPASIRKRGTGLDLAMAMAVLSLELNTGEEHIAAWGEVGLDGTVKPSGQLTRSIYAAWQKGISRLFICAGEYETACVAARWIEKAGFFSTPPPEIIPTSSLSEAWEILQNNSPRRFIFDEEGVFPVEPSAPEHLLPLPASLERAICIAALGNHHLLLLGPKGTGKSHALEWLIALQPEPSYRMRVNHQLLLELDQSRIQNLRPVYNSAPVRRIGAQARASALVGNCSAGFLRPGEFSLAHGGILIADEFPEWSRDSREALREPLERGVVTLTRAKNSIEFPARFSFAANGNLCPCGGWPSEFPIPMEVEKQKSKIPKCRCTHSQRGHYIRRMSGPVLDRMDLVLLVGAPTVQRRKSGDETMSIRFRKLKSQTLLARTRAVESWGGIPAELSPPALERLLELNPTWQDALEQLQLMSLRARHKTIRVALSLAAWDGIREPRAAHFMEASCYRPERFGLCE
jgi:magnesium chelatase family protein